MCTLHEGKQTTYCSRRSLRFWRVGGYQYLHIFFSPSSHLHIVSYDMSRKTHLRFGAHRVMAGWHGKFEGARLRQESASANAQMSGLERELQAYEAGVHDALVSLGFDSGRLRGLKSSTEALDQMKLGIRALLDSESYLLKRTEEMDKEILEHKAECVMLESMLNSMRRNVDWIDSLHCRNTAGKANGEAEQPKMEEDKRIQGFSERLLRLFRTPWASSTSGAKSVVCSEDSQSLQSRQGMRAAFLTSNHSKTWSHLGSLDASGNRFRPSGPPGPDQHTPRLSHAKSWSNLGSHGRGWQGTRVAEDHLRHANPPQSDTAKLEDMRSTINTTSNPPRNSASKSLRRATAKSGRLW